MKTLLTIDWDFFVPEDRALDMGHKEAPFFINEMWAIRTLSNPDLKSILKTNSLEKSFWSWIKSKGFQFSLDTPVTVTESHLHAINIPADKIYSFDAHSDLGYHIEFNNLKQLLAAYQTLDCGNWLGYQALKGADVTVVWSPNTNEDHNHFEKILEWIPNAKILHQASLDTEPRPIDHIHLCRSGAWTPPWLDKKFFRLFKDFKNITCNIEPRKFHINKNNDFMKMAQSQVSATK